MASLKDIRVRIASVNSTKQITSAMKMVSASKLRKAQTQMLKLRPYTQKFNDILKNIGSDIDSIDEGKYSAERELNKVLIVAVTSNRGFCGSFNSNIIKAVNTLIEKEYQQQFKNKSVYIASIGKKANDYYTKRKYNVIDNYSYIYDSLTFENVEQLAIKLVNSYINKEYDRVVIVYNRFKNAAVQELRTEQFLPIVENKKALVTNERQQGAVGSQQSTDFIFEPSREEILKNIIPDFLKMNLYKALLESNASENGARMTAMHIATENATELLKQLKLSYNKARQASITKELLEIVSGAEALKG